MDIQAKRQQEKQLIGEMITLYCRHHHHQDTLCDTCRDLLEYASIRSDHCPRMQQKTFCSRCPVHCYSPAMRSQIRQVMRYSGPRLIFTHPVLVLRHMTETLREKKKGKSPR